MTVKEYLLQIKRMNARLSQLEMEIKEIESKLGAQGVNYGGISGTPSSEDKRSKYIYRLIELRDEYFRQSEELLDKRGEIVKNIQKIPNISTQQVLYYKYVQNRKYEDIADLMGYSLSQIFRFHKYGLREMKMIVNDSITE